ncbi:TniQ family protein [Terrihalobacillus insolitus]|uniref:TniQ family protein n=1 Tax=Terrihalobacillus insolitus TaxID=2950438 RepID=UPI00233FCD5B|nr:TniQ family protein [Terrihalobacillus insolitus]MDC3414769.1 TniQ family protein [Terrihalobacillus insolitus]
MGERILLSIRTKPLEGELLSSFLIRLANENGQDFLKFVNNFKKSSSYYLQRADIDFIDFAPLSLLDIDSLVKISDIEKVEIINGSFLKLVKKFQQENYSNARNFSDLLRSELYYCPLCLIENNCYRIIWKIKNVNVCLNHSTILLTNCWNCEQVIYYRELSTIGNCPHCGVNLKEGNNIEVNYNELNESSIRSWEFLLSNKVENIQSQQLAKKLLFLLNHQKSELDRVLVSENLNEHTSLPTLLQHVRGTKKQQNHLHLEIVLNILSDLHMDFKQLIEVEVPADFEDSLNKKLKIEGVSCLAPWCSSYKSGGSLIKTGTSRKVRIDGTILKYYLICKECGCEYAYDHNDQLIERSYFISAYQKLINFDTTVFSLKSLALELELSLDRTRRILGYFISRLPLRNLGFTKGYVIEPVKLGYFIEELKENKNIKDIRKWDQWKDYNEFLIYRYHIEVINQIYSRENRKITPKNNNSNFLLVKKTVDHLFDENQDITIRNVCTALKISIETVRNWGGNAYIAKMKKKQRKIRLSQMEEEIKRKLDTYFEMTPPEEVSSGHLYRYLGIGRTVLWRINKDLTRLISYRLGTINNEEGS